MPRFDAIGLVVEDLSRSLAFYRMLGLVFDDDSEGGGHVEAVGPGGIRIMFDTADVIRSFSDWEPPAGGYRMALAFLCEDPADVDATWARLTGAGHASKIAPFDAFWGQRYATVLDPDGNPVDLFAPL